MPTEAGRHRLYETIKEQWGENNADELMSYLPPVGWADVATKQDLDALRVATNQDLDALRVATKQDLDALRVATKQDLALLSAEIRAEVGDKISGLQRTMISLMVLLTGIFGGIATVAAVAG